MSTAALVGEMYAAFGRGDIQFLLDQMSPTVSWEDWGGGNTAQAAGVDYLVEREDVGGVGEFFGIVASSLETKRFDVDAIIGDGDEVIVRVTTEWLVRSTGKLIRDEELHWWVFDSAGKVVRFRHYIDTAKHIEANTPS